MALGCRGDSHKYININDLPGWVNNPENGLCKSRSIGGIILNAKLLPADYLVYQETSDVEKANYVIIDSVVAQNKNNLTFLLTIKTDEARMSNQDLMYLGIHDYAEYSNRVAVLNFRVQDYLLLKIGQKEYNPVLASFENTYGLGKELRINVVFTLSDLSAELSAVTKIDFVFNDEIFNTGTNHFIFDSKAIVNIPEVHFSH